ISPYRSPLYPISHNPLFQPGADGKALKHFQKAAYLTLGEILDTTEEQKVKRMQDLIETQTVIQKFQYHQIVHFVHSGPLAHSTKRTQTEFEQHCSKQDLKKKLISVMYTIIQTTHPPQLPLTPQHGKKN
ncbi:Hypothetical predicted protein, partial [Pelobates cultripes]